MADPLDTLYRPASPAEPDPQFRAELMNRLGRELETATTRRSDGDLDFTDQRPDLLEVVMHTQVVPHQSRQRILAGLGVAAAAAVIFGLVVVTRGDDSQPVSTVAPTTVATTTPSRTDAEIATAAVLTRTEVGGGYLPYDGFRFNLDRTTGAGSQSRACAPFLDTVFESPQRPATVKIQMYATVGSDFEQYIAVFPDQSGAVAMMKSVSDAAFPACMAAVATEGLASGLHQALDQTSLVPVTTRTLNPVGDEMTVIRLHGTFTSRGSNHEIASSIPFVRVGRVVVWMNPNSAKNVFNSPGYSDDLLQKSLGVMVAHLRAAQSG